MPCLLASDSAIITVCRWLEMRPAPAALRTTLVGFNWRCDDLKCRPRTLTPTGGSAMPKMTFDPRVKEALDSFLLENVEVEPGKAFGLPAYYVNGKMFAGVYEDGATIKVPEDMIADLLSRDGISEFRPMEKHTMKNWVIIRRENPDDYIKDKDLFQAAFDHVFLISQEKKPSGKKG